MHICYVLLSPTFGMHQYTADLANRMVAAGGPAAPPGGRVTLVTTTHYPADRYAPAVEPLPLLDATSTGLSVASLRVTALRHLADRIAALAPDVVHITGPHLWNAPLLPLLRRRGLPVVHTLHDVEPHHGQRLSLLLRFWNRVIIREADQILVHGRAYRRRLLARGLPSRRVTYAPLLHLFLSYEQLCNLQQTPAAAVSYEPFVLFFGRLERYKGVEHLLTAFAQINHHRDRQPWRLVLAGPGAIARHWTGDLPAGVELRNRLIDDAEALDLFRRCSLVVLPYTGGTQSALVGAAYYFRKPVLVARTGALAEDVAEGRTGFVVEPGHPATLARALARAMDDPPALRHMGAAGRDWYDRSRLQELPTIRRLYEQMAGAAPSAARGASWPLVESFERP